MKAGPPMDRRHALIGVAGLGLAACSSAPPTQGPRLRLATFNIWHDMGDWPRRLPRVLALLRAADADVIALQEVLQDPARQLPNQAATLAQALGYRWHFASVDDEQRPRRYGNALLTRLPVVEQDWKKLAPLDDYRCAQRLRVLLDGRPVDVVNTHLHHTPGGGAIRARQLADLFDWLGPPGAVPRLLMGDFNATLDDAGMALLRPPHFESLLARLQPQQARRSTLDTALGHAPAQIDHLLYPPDRFEPLQASLHDHGPGADGPASDHFAVSGALRLRG